MSRYYRVDLGLLDVSTQQRFEAWAHSQRHRHVLTNGDDGKVMLYAEREGERSAKAHVTSLRTTFNHNWRIPVQLPAGFLSLLSEGVPRCFGKLLVFSTDRSAHGVD